MTADRHDAVAQILEAAHASDSQNGAVVVEAIEQGRISLGEDNVALFLLACEFTDRRHRERISRRQRRIALQRQDMHRSRNLYLLDVFVSKLRSSNGRSASAIAKDIGDGREKWNKTTIRLGVNAVVAALERALEIKYPALRGKVRGLHAIVSAIKSQGTST